MNFLFNIFVTLAQKIIMLWVKPLVAPKDLNSLGFDKNKPTVYVLKTKSIIDTAVLKATNKKNGLFNINNKINSAVGKNWASVIYLQKLGILQTKRLKKPPMSLFTLLERIQKQEAEDFQIIPITIIWGRGPDPKEKSILKLLFSDDENAGIIQKIIISIFHGRDSYIEYGKPISLKEQLISQLPIEETAKKIRRILRVHFVNQRIAVLGPTTENQRRIFLAILQSKNIQKLINNESKSNKSSLAKFEKKVYLYLKEIASNQKASVIKAFDLVLSGLWARISSGFQLWGEDRLFELSKTHEIIYAPTHKSHLDYLITGYLLYKNGMPVPYFAAGKNLNFWPIGPILRRGGAFFLRRSFGGNKLYTGVFKEYLSYLITHGFHIIVFIEGGRSRTGRLLTPKTGLLSMIIQSYAQDITKPIAIVPTYVSYDRIIEFKSYLNELKGGKKTKESFFEFLKVWKILKTNYGKTYLNFGKPIFLEDKLNESVPNWEESSKQDKPQWLNNFSSQIATNIMTSLAQSAILTPINLVSMALSNRASLAIDCDELRKFTQICYQIIPILWSNTEIKFSLESYEEAIKYVEKSKILQKKSHPNGDIYSITPDVSLALQYYKNESIHIFALLSKVFEQFIIHKRTTAKDIVNEIITIYPNLKNDYFLNFDSLQLPTTIRTILDKMQDLKIIQDQDGYLQKNTTDESIAILKNFANIIDSKS